MNSIFLTGERMFLSYDSKLTSLMSIFKIHPSIRLIKDKYQQSLNSKFEFVSLNQVLKYISEIDCNKCTGGDITTKTTKIAKEELAVSITNYK